MLTVMKFLLLKTASINAVASKTVSTVAKSETVQRLLRTFQAEKIVSEITSASQLSLPDSEIEMIASVTKPLFLLQRQ